MGKAAEGWPEGDGAAGNRPQKEQPKLILKELLKEPHLEFLRSTEDEMASHCESDKENGGGDGASLAHTLNSLYSENSSKM